MTTLREYCRGTWHPIWTVSLLSRQKRFVLRLLKKSFSDLIWRGTKVDHSRLRCMFVRLLRNLCCRIVASLVCSLDLVFCLPCFSLIKNSLSFWVASMYISYAVPLYPILLDLSFCALYIWSRVYFLLLTSVCEIAILFFM